MWESPEILPDPSSWGKRGEIDIYLEFLQMSFHSLTMLRSPPYCVPTTQLGVPPSATDPFQGVDSQLILLSCHWAIYQVQ